VKASTQTRHLTRSRAQMTGDVDSSEVLERVAVSLRTYRAVQAASTAGMEHYQGPAAPAHQRARLPA
jgi:hypothetical protein